MWEIIVFSMIDLVPAAFLTGKIHLFSGKTCTFRANVCTAFKTRGSGELRDIRRPYM
jgi:hypothetical protein